MGRCCARRMQCRGDSVVGRVGSSCTKSRMEMDCLVEYVPCEAREHSGLRQNGRFSRFLVRGMVSAIMCISVITSLAEPAMAANYAPGTFSCSTLQSVCCWLYCTHFQSLSLPPPPLSLALSTYCFLVTTFSDVVTL